MFRAASRRIDTDPASGGGRRRAKVGIVLGAGAARGWAHIGALRELDALGVQLECVVCSSIGTLVGGCYAAGRLDMLETFARSLTRRRVLGLLDFSFTGSGLIGGPGRSNSQRSPPRSAADTRSGSGAACWSMRSAPLTHCLAYSSR